VPHDADRAVAIAAAYEALPEVSDDPIVVRAYKALGDEVQRQWDFAEKEMGIRFRAWSQKGQPYANSSEMIADVADNKRLYFFTGGEPHPMLNTPDENGLTLNDKLRAIHDLFGHAAEDFQFGARGEENAWLKHSQMFSPEAQRALTTETRGQNSWVNFGPQNFNEDGSPKNIAPADRPFADQKVALLPEEFSEWQSLLNPPVESANAPAMTTKEVTDAAWKHAADIGDKLMKAAGLREVSPGYTPGGIFSSGGLSPFVRNQIETMRAKDRATEGEARRVTEKYRNWKAGLEKKGIPLPTEEQEAIALGNLQNPLTDAQIPLITQAGVAAALSARKDYLLDTLTDAQKKK